MARSMDAISSGRRRRIISAGSGCRTPDVMQGFGLQARTRRRYGWTWCITRADDWNSRYFLEPGLVSVCELCCTSLPPITRIRTRLIDRMQAQTPHTRSTPPRAIRFRTYPPAGQKSGLPVAGLSAIMLALLETPDCGQRGDGAISMAPTRTASAARDGVMAVDPNLAAAQASGRVIVCRFEAACIRTCRVCLCLWMRTSSIRV